MTCPWYITHRAVEDYCELHGWPDDDEHFDRGENELLELAERAHHVRDQDNGLQLWRGPTPGRLRLLVSTAKRPEGDLPQLVRVLPASDRTTTVASAEPHQRLDLPKLPRSTLTRWRDAAARADMSLNNWVIDTLDRAARMRRPPR